MRYILLILLYLFLNSCKTQDKKAYSNLEGEWMNYVAVNEVPSRDIGIIFNNDTLFEINSEGMFILGRYNVKNDTINVFRSDSTHSYWMIHKLSVDSLIVSNHGRILKYYNRQLELNSSLSFNEIFITSRNYNSKCSEFELEIDKKTKILRFNGLGNCERLGKYEVIIDDKELTKLDSIFKWSYLEHLDTTRDYGSDDEWSIILEINYNKDSSKTINGSYWDLPYQIKPVVRYLFYLKKKYEFI